LFLRGPVTLGVVRTTVGLDGGGDLHQWAKSAGMAIQYIAPGQTQPEMSNRAPQPTFREELLDQYLFTRLDDVREAPLTGANRLQRGTTTQRPVDLTPAEYYAKFRGNFYFETVHLTGKLTVRRRI